MPKILFIHFVFLCGIDLRFRICYYVTIQSYIKIDENSLGYYEQIIIKYISKCISNISIERRGLL